MAALDNKGASRGERDVLMMRKTLTIPGGISQSLQSAFVGHNPGVFTPLLRTQSRLPRSWPGT